MLYWGGAKIAHPPKTPRFGNIFTLVCFLVDCRFRPFPKQLPVRTYSRFHLGSKPTPHFSKKCHIKVIVFSIVFKFCIILLSSLLLGLINFGAIRNTV